MPVDFFVSVFPFLRFFWESGLCSSTRKIGEFFRQSPVKLAWDMNIFFYMWVFLCQCVSACVSFAVGGGRTVEEGYHLKPRFEKILYIYFVSFTTAFFQRAPQFVHFFSRGAASSSVRSPGCRWKGSGSWFFVKHLALTPGLLYTINNYDIKCIAAIISLLHLRWRIRRFQRGVLGWRWGREPSAKEQEIIRLIIDGQGGEEWGGGIPPPRAQKSDPPRQKNYVLLIPLSPILPPKVANISTISLKKAKFWPPKAANKIFLHIPPSLPPRPKDFVPPSTAGKTALPQDFFWTPPVAPTHGHLWAQSP